MSKKDEAIPTTVRLPPDLHEALKNRPQRMNDFIVAAVRERLARETEETEQMKILRLIAWYIANPDDPELRDVALRLAGRSDDGVDQD